MTIYPHNLFQKFSSQLSQEQLWPSAEVQQLLSPKLWSLHEAKDTSHYY